MKNSSAKNEQRLARMKKGMKKNKKAITAVLACAAVVATTGALMHPAITLDENTAENSGIGVYAGSAVEGVSENTSLTYEGSAYTVTASFAEDAQIPADARLEVTEITADSADEATVQEYNGCMSRALAEYQKTDGETTELTDARFFNIKFYEGENEIKPQADVIYKFDWKDDQTAASQDTVSVLRIDTNDGEKEPEIIADEKTNVTAEASEDGTSVTIDDVSFQAGAAADNTNYVYGVTEPKVYSDSTLTADGGDYSVTVTYTKNAKIPDGAVLKTSEIAEGTDEYNSYCQKSVDEINANLAEGEEQVSALEDAHVYDNTIWYEGQEIQPAQAVDVTITPKDAVQVEDKSQITAVHFADNNGEETPEILNITGTDGDENTVNDIVFQQNSFSVTTVGKMLRVSSATNSTEDSTDSTDSDAEATVSATSDSESSTSSNTTDLGAPQADKEMTENTETAKGTYQLHLSVVGKKKTTSTPQNQHVLVIVDKSSSMVSDTSPDATKTRLKITQDRLTAFATDLMADGNIDMGLITFGSEVYDKYEPTTNSSTFNNNVNSIQSVDISHAVGGGIATNWEDALQEAAKYIDNQGWSKDNTSIIFFTDGYPTYRISKGKYNSEEWPGYSRNLDSGINGSYTSSSGKTIYGWGVDYEHFLTTPLYNESQANAYLTNVNVCLEEALDDARTLNTKGTLYTISAFESSKLNTDLRNRTKELSAYAYGDDTRTNDQNNYLVDDEPGLQEAFEKIANEIKKEYTYGNVTLTDVLTQNTSTNLVVGDSVANAGKFIYTITEADGLTKHTFTSTDSSDYRSSLDSTLQAEYDRGLRFNATVGDDGKTIQWALGENYQLQEGWKYEVEFTVWPDQTAYDTVAEIKNETLTNTDTTKTEEDIFNEKNAAAATPGEFYRDNDSGKYYLYSNTSDGAKVTYHYVETENGTSQIDTTPKDSYIDSHPKMPLETRKIVFQKDWENASESDKKEITINLQVDSETVEIKLNSGNEYTAEYYVAPGLKSDGVVGRTKDPVLDTGHTYKFEESTTLENFKTSYVVDFGDNTSITLSDTEIDEFSFNPKLINSNSDVYVCYKENASANENTTVMLEDGELTLKAVNTKEQEPFNVVVKKVTSGGSTLLPGAEFSVYNEDQYDKETNTFTGDPVKTFTTDATDTKEIFNGTGSKVLYLLETKAPAGYVKLEKPIKVTIITSTDGTVTVQAYKDAGDGSSLAVDPSSITSTTTTRTFTITVDNNPGAKLPSTGGSGMKMIYLLGAMLTAGACVALVSRKKQLAHK